MPQPQSGIMPCPLLSGPTVPAFPLQRPPSGAGSGLPPPSQIPWRPQQPPQTPGNSFQLHEEGTWRLGVTVPLQYSVHIRVQLVQLDVLAASSGCLHVPILSTPLSLPPALLPTIDCALNHCMQVQQFPSQQVLQALTMQGRHLLPAQLPSPPPYGQRPPTRPALRPPLVSAGRGMQRRPTYPREMQRSGAPHIQFLDTFLYGHKLSQHHGVTICSTPAGATLCPGPCSARRPTGCR